MSFSEFTRRAVDEVRNYLSRDWIYEVPLFEEVTPFLRLHLTQFYFALVVASVSSAIGSCLYHIGIIGCPFAVSAACVNFIAFYLSPQQSEYMRPLSFIFGACFGGSTITPWVSWWLDVDTGFIASTLLASCVGFVCFWGSSKWVPIYEFTYVVTLVLYIILFVVSLFITSTVFGGHSALWKYRLQAYIFLVAYMAYLMDFSQLVVVKALKGDRDHAMHAVCFYALSPAFLLHAIKCLSNCIDDYYHSLHDRANDWSSRDRARR